MSEIQKGKNLYHYTSMDVIRNLFTESEKGIMYFYASSIIYMNDSKEFSAVSKRINYNEKGISEMTLGLPFVISLTERGDYVPMWGMYGDKGHGVCLVFDEDKLKEHIGLNIKEDITVDIKECCYDNNPFNVQENTSDDIRDIKEINELVKSWGNYKPTCFEYEHEHRIVIYVPWTTCPKELFFRSKGSSLVTYVKYKIPFSCLKKIIVGPCANFDKEVMALQLLRNKFTENNIEIVKSKTTLSD